MWPSKSWPGLLVKNLKTDTRLGEYVDKILRADVLNAVYFRRGLTCTLGLTNNLIDGGQPRVKPLCKAKPNLLLAFGWPPSIKSLVNPRVHVRPRLNKLRLKHRP